MALSNFNENKWLQENLSAEAKLKRRRQKYVLTR